MGITTLTLEERFWAKVDKNGPVPEHRPDLGPCWVWTACLSPKGYGWFNCNGTNTGAHRVAFVFLVGPLEPGQPLDHLCRVRHCVNPGHLEPVTPKENTLRGEGITALQARQTHCKRGHEFTAENTNLYRGSRYCRACKRLRERKAA